MSATVGRIQFSPRGISVYDVRGSFICRIEDADDREFFNWCVVNALKEISKMQQKRAMSGKGTDA